MRHFSDQWYWIINMTDMEPKCKKKKKKEKTPQWIPMHSHIAASKMETVSGVTIQLITPRANTDRDMEGKGKQQTGRWAGALQEETDDWVKKKKKNVNVKRGWESRWGGKQRTERRWRILKERWHRESEGDNGVALTVWWHAQRAGSAVSEEVCVCVCVYVRCTYRGHKVCACMCRDVEN